MGVANGKDKTYYEMTPEQALDKLDKTVIGDLVFKIALTTALEKQIPRKPTSNEFDILIGNIDWFKSITTHYCPNCKEFIGRTYAYCHKCGQKLDWEER